MTPNAAPALFAMVLLVGCSRGEPRPPQATVAEGTITTPDGERLYYQIHGQGRDTLIAVHGGPGETIANLWPVLQPLARDHAVVVYDQRGNGRSSAVADSTRITIEHHLGDLDALRTQLHLERPVLLGHSWGGDLVALYAARHPDAVARLILVDPGPPRAEPFDAQSRVGRMAGFDSTALSRLGGLIQAALADTATDPVSLCRTFYGLFLRNYYVDTLGRQEAVANDCAYPGYNLRRANRVSRLTEESGYAGRQWDTLVGAVQAPVLVIHGADDFIPLGSSELWAKAFPAGRLLVIEQSSHSPFVDRPDAFFPAVETFLSGGWPAAARE